MTWVVLKWSCFSDHENIGQSGLMACWVFSNLKDLQCELDFAENIDIININKQCNYYCYLFFTTNTKSPIKSSSIHV